MVLKMKYGKNQEVYTTLDNGVVYVIKEIYETKKGEVYYSLYSSGDKGIIHAPEKTIISKDDFLAMKREEDNMNLVAWVFVGIFAILGLVKYYFENEG